LRRFRGLALVGVAAGLSAAGSAPAVELWHRGDAYLELGGSLRERLVVTRVTDADEFTEAITPACAPVESFPDCPAFDEVGERDVWTSLTRLRTRLDARATDWLSAVVVYDHEALFGILDTFESELGEALREDRFVDLTGDLVDEDRARWRHLLYRGYVLVETERLELTVGRQRVPWGVGRLWNPIDRFNAIGPLSIEADQSQGVDALKARWLFSGFTFLEAIYAAGETGNDRSVAGRLHGVLHDVDYSLIGGVFEEAPTFGFDLAANLWDAAGRVEVVWTDPKRRVRPFGDREREALPDYWQIVVSLDHNVDVGSGLYVLVEHLYNGNALGFGRGEAGGLLGFFQETGKAPARFAAPGTSDLFGQSRVVTLGEHLTGGQLGYELTPEIRGDLLAIYDWDGQSATFFPSLRYSPLHWLELTIGVQLFTGTRRSEFGDRDALGFLLADVFF
jgi:hypothetical protein